MSVQCGTFYLGNRRDPAKVNPKWQLSKGGEASYTVRVNFPYSFDDTPAVCVSIAGIDAVVGGDGSWDVQMVVTGLDLAFFDLVVKKHGDFQINTLDVAWVAHD